MAVIASCLAAILISAINLEQEGISWNESGPYQEDNALTLGCEKMKTIGLLGGMSWESTRTYYNHLNTLVKERMGGLNSARLLLSSVNFAELEACLSSGDWAEIETRLKAEARKVQAGGADCLILCTNTMHKIAPQLEAAIDIPFLHIADALGDDLQRQGISCIGLLGTRFTMVEDFYAARLKQKFGIDTLIPSDEDIARIDAIIFQELCLGVVRDESRAVYLEIMDKLTDQGAASIALACTEIEMLIRPEDTAIPLNDTTYLHAAYAAGWAMQNS